MSASPFHDLDALKPRLPIPEAWQRLGLPGQPAASCRSPFREDRKPSFSIYNDGLRWKDQATGDGGDVIDFIAHACHLDKAEAIRRFLSMLDLSIPHHTTFPKPSNRHTEASGPFLPALHRGTVAEIEAVAAMRGLRPDAISLAQSLGTLGFGKVSGQACWVLTDRERRIAEARRVDGRLFPAQYGLIERKAHTLRGSCKAWPVGVAVLHELPAFRALMLVEGGPDYLAALHFLCAAEVWDVLPVAMLGRSTGSRIDPAALELMKGRRVRIYPHADADGGGATGARRWAAQLQAQGCTVDHFPLGALVLPNGSQINDLNDAARLPADQQSHLTHLLP